jgi:hypothetical protein
MAIGNQFYQSQSSSLSQRGRKDNANAAENIKELAYKAFVVCHDQKLLVEAWLPDTVGVDVTADYEAPFAQGLGGSGTGANLLKLGGVSLTTQALSMQVWQGGSYIKFNLPFIFQAENSGKDDVMLPIKNLMRLTMPKESGDGGLLIAPGPHLDTEKTLKNNVIGKIGEGVVVGGFATLAASAGIAGGGLVSTVASEVAKFTTGKMHDMATDLANGSAKFSADSFKYGVDTVSKSAAEVSKAIVNSVVNNISLYIGQFMYFPCVVIRDVSPTYDVVLGRDKNPVRATVNVSFETFYIPTQADIDSMFPSSYDTYAGVSASPNNSAAARG